LQDVFQKNMPLSWAVKEDQEQNEILLLGNMKEGQLHGWGIELCATAVTIGFFSSVNIVQGKEIFVHGDRYDGQFLTDQHEGWGTYYYTSLQSREEGEFKNGKLNGKASYTWPGGRFEGMYKDDKVHGLGLLTWKEGSRYQGEFHLGLPKDADKAIQPTALERIKRKVCTYGTGETSGLSQFVYRCEDCAQDFCFTCWETCHEYKTHSNTKLFFIDSFCDCGHKGKCSCVDKVPPIKRQKLR